MSPHFDCLFLCIRQISNFSWFWKSGVIWKKSYEAQCGLLLWTQLLRTHRQTRLVPGCNCCGRAGVRGLRAGAAGTLLGPTGLRRGVARPRLRCRRHSALLPTEASRPAWQGRRHFGGSSGKGQGGVSRVSTVNGERQKRLLPAAAQKGGRRAKKGD